jgi:hypothetical protein
MLGVGTDWYYQLPTVGQHLIYQSMAVVKIGSTNSGIGGHIGNTNLTP